MISLPLIYILTGAAVMLLFIGIMIYLLVCLKKEKQGKVQEMAQIVSDVEAGALEDTRTLQLYPYAGVSKRETVYKLLDSRTEIIYPLVDQIDIGMSSLKGTREYQQDMADVKICGTSEERNRRIIGVLCDGMGGLESGERASAVAVTTMMKELDVSWSEFPQVFQDVLADVNYQIYSLKNEKTGKRLHAGTTLTSVVIEDGKMYWCSVGDSRIYLFRNRCLLQLTRDHIYGNDLDEMVSSGQITEKEAKSNPGRAALTSYLGVQRLEKINYNLVPEELVAGDIVLQCSDGLYRSLSEKEIIFILERCVEDMQHAARSLTMSAVSRPGGHDNTTALLLCYKGTSMDEERTMGP